MAKTDNGKSSAEAYREERKKRLAQASKKNAKRNAKYPNLAKRIKVTVALVLVVAIVGGIAAMAMNSLGTFRMMRTAMKVGDEKISVAEFDYFYRQQYQNTCTQAEYYTKLYNYNVMGFDATVSPAEQMSNQTDEDGNTLTWAEYIKNNTINWVKELYVFYNEAVKAGYTLDDEDKETIEEGIEEMRTYAVGQQLSLSAFIRNYYGPGLTERSYRKLLEKTTLAQNYSTDFQEKCEEYYTDEMLAEYYASDTDAYDSVDMRSYSFSTETLTKEENETDEALAARQEIEDAKVKAKADAMLAGITDEASFMALAQKAEDTAAAEKLDITATTTDDAAAAEKVAASEDTYDEDVKTQYRRKTKETVKSGVSEDAAKWAFADGRKVGDTAVFKGTSAYYVLYLTKTQYAVNTVSVRHILFQTVDDNNSPLSAEEIAAAKEKADAVLAKYESGDKTEESFAALATQSDDSGSVEEGGLYEDVNPGTMVTEFDNWIYDESRKPGDVEIIESSYGYHVMYFVSNNEDSLVWRNTLRSSMGQDKYSEDLTAMIESEEYTYVPNEANLTEATNDSLKLIDRIIATNNASSTQTY